MREWYAIQNKGAEPAIAEVRVFGPIGKSWADDDAVGAKPFVEALDRVPASTTTIRVLVNSPGGDVFDALAIANALRAQRMDRRRTVAVSIEGVAASAATLITSAGSTVAIADNALTMVHNPRGFALGEAADMRRMAEALDHARGSIITTYRWLSYLSADALGRLMDAVTWMDCDATIKNGFATHKVTGARAAACALCPQARALLGTVPVRYRPTIDGLGTPADPGAAWRTVLEDAYGKLNTSAGWGAAVDKVNRARRA